MARTEAKRNLNAWSVMRSFYSHLERRLKRFQPIDYAPFASMMMRKGLDDIRIMRKFPPFKVLHSIEANCTYARGQNRDAVTRDSLGDVMNMWYDHPNPLFEEEIKGNLQHFFLLLTREQMDLQYSHSRAKTARVQRLFVTDNPMPGVSSEFEQYYGLTMKKWINLCWLSYVASQAGEFGCFLKNDLMAYEGFNVTQNDLTAYFSQASRTPAQIKERFKSVVLEMSPELRFLIRSVFLETPIIDFGEGRVHAPHFDLILRNSGNGLYRLIKPLPSFDQEFGKSVQEYTRGVLECLEGVLSFFGDKELVESSGEAKSCDFLLELDECILLIECKATTFIATGLLENAILRDGSTGKVAKGLVQLYSTAYEITSGTFSSLAISQDKPILGIVATFGDIPLANNDWYFESFILTRAEGKLRKPIYPNDGMERRPLVMSLQTLEDLVVFLNNTRMSPLGLYDEKQNIPYAHVGDWDTYLRSKRRDLGEGVQPLTFVQPEFDELFVQLTGQKLLDHLKD